MNLNLNRLPSNYSEIPLTIRLQNKTEGQNSVFRHSVFYAFVVGEGLEGALNHVGELGFGFVAAFSHQFLTFFI